MLNRTDIIKIVKEHLLLLPEQTEETVNKLIDEIMPQLKASQLEAQVKPEITEKLKELLRQVYDILAEAPELNMNNYDEEQVKKLNDKMIEAYYLLNYEQRQFLV